jgi:hypothetical protein
MPLVGIPFLGYVDDGYLSPRCCYLQLHVRSQQRKEHRLRKSISLLKYTSAPLLVGRLYFFDENGGHLPAVFCFFPHFCKKIRKFFKISKKVSLKKRK